MMSASHAATILVWGDSLSAGYGIAREAAWPQLLAAKLKAEGYRYTVTNASISGETTAGGKSRLAAALAEHKPAVMILALGANDGLRGQPLPAMRDNLEHMIRTAQQAGARVLVMGMRLPPNFGPRYTGKFHDTFADVATANKAALLPFMLDGFAERSEFFISDGIHPNADAQPLILANLWPKLRPLLRK